MHPTFLAHPHISSYSVFLLLGFAAGYLITRRLAVRHGFEGRHIDNLILILMVAGPLGARLCSRFFYHPGISVFEALQFWKGGGLVFYGGVFLGLASVLAYAAITRLSTLRLLDVFAPGLAVGLAFGRIGCFLAGCCWGDVCIHDRELAAIRDPLAQYQVHSIPGLSGPGFPLAVQYPERSEALRQHRRMGLASEDSTLSRPVHPVQLYEAAAALWLFGLLHRRINRSNRPETTGSYANGQLGRVTPCAPQQWQPDFEIPGCVPARGAHGVTRSAESENCRPGTAALGFVVGYGLVRFALEFLRADNRPVYLGMTFSQAVSLAALAIAGVLWVGWNYRLDGRNKHIRSVRRGEADSLRTTGGPPPRVGGCETL
jgi:phosphatidylglycerol:prolipoprotein diacylglycerol transferase